MDDQTPAPAPQQPGQSSTLRPWYKKKRYLIPLGFVGLMAATSLGGSGWSNLKKFSQNSISSLSYR